MSLVMLALPFVLCGLIVPELSTISSRIEQEGPDDINWDIEPFLDPVHHIFEVLVDFMDWFITVRTHELPIKQLNALIIMAINPVETLKHVFLKRDGKESGWKIGKCHDVLHVAENIALFGWSQNTSGEWGERSHIDLIKNLSGLVNNNDIFLQFAKWHQRSGMLQREIQATNDTDLPVGSDEESQAPSQPEAGTNLRKNKLKTENPPCELAVRYPLLHAAVHFKELIYSKGSNGYH